MIKLKWCADLKAESDYRAMAITFSKQTIRFSQIDLKESSFNGARLGDTIINDLVNDYAQGMINGDTFPSVVVYKAKNGKFIIISGNQRSNAIAKLIAMGKLPKDPTMEVYVLDTADQMLLEAVARSANVSHGSRTTATERMAHAIYMVTKYGMKPSDAALLYMVSCSSINHNLRAEKVRRDLGKQNIDVSSLPNSAIEPLRKLENDNGSFLKVGSLVAQHRPTAERVKQIINRVDRAKSDAGRLSVVKTIEKELSQESKSYPNKKGDKKSHPKMPDRPRRDKIIYMLERLTNFLAYEKDGNGFTSLDELQIATEADEDRIRKLWSQLELKMKVILKTK